MKTFTLILALGLFCLGVRASMAQEPSGDPVVAVVGGEEIRLSEVEAMRADLPPRARAYPLAAVFGLLLKELVDSKLVALEARRTGLAEEADVKRRLVRVEERVLREEFLNRRLDGQITEERLRERYARFVAENPGSEEVWARHILVETEEKAAEVVARLAKGDDFAALARKLSTGPSASSGGDLGYFTRERMLPAFSKAAFALKKGEITRRPVRTRYGWHVIKVEGRRSAKPPSFAKARGQMRQQIVDELVKRLIADLSAKTKVETFGPKGRP